MSKPKILVVEDERVVAADIEDSLSKLGYKVVGAAASGASAIRRAVETEPDLVLMDIKLKGRMDGIDTAGELHHRLGIPVVFLTAYADGEILDRAKKTSPSGYVLKPYDERALRSAVELALHRHPLERRLAESEHRLVTALRAFNDAVIITDRSGRVTFINQTAERLTGWSHAEAAGHRFADVFTAVQSRTGSLVPDPTARVLREGIARGLGEHTILINRYGGEAWVEGTVNPLRDDDNEVVGAAMVFHSAVLEGQSAAEIALRVSSRLETAGRLAGGFSSAIAAALHSVVTAAEAIKTSSAGEDISTKLGQLIDDADRARKLAGLLRRLADRGIPRPRTLDLNEFITDLEAIFPHITGESISVESLCRDDAGSVSADPTQLEQLLLDLVLLSGQRMPCGGKITIETDDVELLAEYAHTHTCLEPGRYVVLSISSAGAVMMPAAEDAQADCPAVLEIVRDLAGDIVLRSEPGRLITYEIYLPKIT